MGGAYGAEINKGFVLRRLSFNPLFRVIPTERAEAFFGRSRDISIRLELI